jgi:hypothetical protein
MQTYKRRKRGRARSAFRSDADIFAELFDVRFFLESGGFVRWVVTALLLRRKGGASVYDGRRFCGAAEEALRSSLGFPGQRLAAL